MGFCGKPHIFSLSENILIFTLTIPRLLLSKPKAFISPFTRYKTFVSLLKELLSGVAFFTAKRWYLYITSLCSSVSSCKWAGLSHWINSLFPHFSSQPLIIPDCPLSPIISHAEGSHFPDRRLPIAVLTSRTATLRHGAGFACFWGCRRVLSSRFAELPVHKGVLPAVLPSPFAAPQLLFQAAPKWLPLSMAHKLQGKKSFYSFLSARGCDDFLMGSFINWK